MCGNRCLYNSDVGNVTYHKLLRSTNAISSGSRWKIYSYTAMPMQISDDFWAICFQGCLFKNNNYQTQLQHAKLQPRTTQYGKTVQSVSCICVPLNLYLYDGEAIRRGTGHFTLPSFHLFSRISLSSNLLLFISLFPPHFSVLPPAFLSFPIF